MSTGAIENWAGTMADVGPLYPFVGSEFALWCIGVALWIVWHIVLTRKEGQQYEDDIKKLGGADTVKKRIADEAHYD